MEAGHHWMPITTIEKFRGQLSEGAIDVALGAASGPLQSGYHNGRAMGGVKHSRYTELVGEQFEKYIKDLKLKPGEKVTDEQIHVFIDRMQEGKLYNGKDPGSSKYKDIGKFNDAISSDAVEFQ